VPASIAEVVLISAPAVTHGFNQNQRLIGCVITGTTATAVEVMAPPDHTLAPHGWYMLFLIDADRTPSTAAWVRVS
jgi:hypothetical protein